MNTLYLRLSGICMLTFFCCLEIWAQCAVTADAGPDQAVCNAGDVVVLGGNFTGSAFAFSWSPPLGLSDPNSLTPSATVNNTITYTLTVVGESTSNPNLIVNGDFESGPAGFTSDYTFAAPSNPFALASPGTYTITTSPNIVLNTFPPCDDHTFGDGTGNMMVVNGGSSPGTQAWCQTVNVSPNTYYVFTAFVSSVHGFAPGALQLSINGSNVGNQLNLSSGFCSWTGMTEIWFSGGNTSADICLLDMGTGSGILANDYMLDDISLVAACESEDEVEVQVLSSTAAVASPFASIDCEGDCIFLDASPSSAGAGTTYQWTATNGGVIQSGESSTMPEVCAGGEYTLVVTNSLNGVSCPSDPVSVTVDVLGALPEFPVIGGIDIACNGANESYSVLGAASGVMYNWSVAGGQITGGQGSGQISVDWLSQGPGVICVVGENNCGRSQEACFPVDVTAGLSGRIDTTLCWGDSILLNGSYYGGNQLSGVETFTAANGCDSTLTIEVAQRSPQEFTYQRVICAGDSSWIGNAFQFSPGVYIDSFVNRYGCDSIITTQLEVLNFDVNDPPTVVCASQACAGLVDAGPDMTFCSPVPPVQLNGIIQGDPVSFTWTPSTGLSNPSILNPTATVSTTTTYTLSATVRSGNLVTNGDFEGGPAGFSTDYAPGTSSCLGLGFLDCEGTFAVLTNPMDGHSQFSACSDVVGGGNMMVVNGAAAFQNVWCQTINVNPNTNYDFSAWVASVNPQSPAILQFSINGSTIGPVFNAGAPCAWGQFSAVWNSGGNTSATICILNQNTSAGGNDFALDGIAFSEVCEAMDEVTIHVLDLVPDITPPDQIDCNDPNSCIFLNAAGTITNGNGLNFLWTASGGGVIQSGARTATPLVCNAGTYTLTVNAELNGVTCTEMLSVNVSDNMAIPPDPLILGPQVVCGDSTFTYTILDDPSYTDYGWQLISGGSIQSGQGTNEVIVRWDDPGGAELCLLVSNSCNQTGFNCITVNLLDTLAAPELNGDTLICESDSLQTYTVSDPDTLANRLTWSVSTGASIEGGQGTDTVQVNWGTAGGGTLCLELSGICDTVESCITVALEQGPPSLQIQGPTAICEGQTDTLLYTLSPVLGIDTIRWTVPPGARIIDGAATDSLRVSWESGSGGSICVGAGNDCGEVNNCYDVVITPSLSSSFDTMLCGTNTFVLNGTVYGNGNISGQEVFTSQAGCDSVVTVTVMEAQGDTVNVQATTCNPNEVGVVQDLLVNAEGCDSVVVTTTTLLMSDTTELFLTSCDPNDVGTTQVLLTNTNNCDSLVITTTSLLESDTTELFLTSCDPNDIGTTQVLLTNADNCDSLVIMTTSLLQSDTTELFLTSCDPNDVGTAQVLLTNANNCDSLVITTTSLLQSDTTEIFLTSCDPNDVGTAQVLLTNADNCDSLVITTTSFLESDTTELFLTSCDPNDIGTTQVLLTNADNCDSLVITTTSFLESDTTELFLTSCDPNDIGTTEVLLTNADNCDSLVITTTSFLESDTTELFLTSCDPNDIGTTQVLLTNADNCDSLVITTTSFLESDTTELFLTSCDPNDVGTTQVLLTNADNCDSLVITTTSFLESDTTELFLTSCDPNDIGTTQVLLTNADNCDSLVITTTSFLESDTTELFLTSCDPNDIGTTEVLLTNADNCDSLVITTTSFLESDTTELFLTSCDPNDIGTTQVLLTNADNCDSLVITTTSLLQSDTTELFLTSCDPNNVGTTQTLLMNVNNCDSLVITTTSLLESDTTELFLTSCDPNDVGTTQTLLTNANSCDSLIITTTSLLESDTTELFLTSCDPNNVGTTQTLLTNANNCDSLVITTTTLLPSDTTDLFQTSCDPTMVGQTSLVLTNQNGCDSLIRITTSLASPDSCGITVLVFSDTIGCNETTASLELLVTLGQAPFAYQWEGSGLNPLGQGNIANLNQSVFINGLSAGDYQITITSAGGFEQILNATILQDPPVFIEAQILSDYNGVALSCPDAEDGMATATLLSGGTGPFSYRWSDGQQGEEAINLGEGWHFVTLTDAEGCEAIDSILLMAPEPLLLAPVATDITCFERNDGSLILTSTEGGTPPYQYSFNNTPFQTDTAFFNLSNGPYTLDVVDANGCRTQGQGVINRPPPAIIALGQDTTIQLGDSIRIQAATNIPVASIDSLIWTNVNCNACLQTFVRPLVTTTYELTLIDEQGCTAQDEITVQVVNDRKVYIPNVFSPNGDGINDVFLIFADDGVRQVNSLQIYSRWGEKVFGATNFQPNDVDYGWDGIFKGERLNPAVFVYWAWVEFEDGAIVLFKGDVTLME